MREVLKVVLFAVLVAGCGDAVVGQDDGEAVTAEALVGFYEVTSHAYDDGACGDGAPVDPGPPVFEIYQEAFGGSDFLFARACASTTDCDAAIEQYFVAQFMVPVGDGFAGASYASYDAAPCRLIEIDGDVVPTDGGVHLEILWRELSAPLEGDACSPAAAQDRADEMACLNARTIDGARIE
jgi:hypothetical protein